jgi:hypothetical protein
MRNITLLIRLSFIGVALLGAAIPVVSVNAEPATIALFNGRDLEGWRFHVVEPGIPIEEVWSVRDGLLVTTGKPFGYLFTKALFENFRLRVEWRWPEGVEPTNSGVLLRMDETPRSFLTKCVEAQLRHGNAGDIIGFYGFEVAGDPDRSFDREHPVLERIKGVRKIEDAERAPGEWNEYIITLKADRLELEINGIKVNQAHGLTISQGAIGLQSEGGPVEFRTVEIIPL